MEGQVNYECEEGSKFSQLSDETPLAVFLGFLDQDNELLKVLKALMTLQVCLFPISAVNQTILSTRVS